MSTDPIKPNDQSTSDVWQPTVDKSDQGAGDETTAADNYDKIYGGSYTKPPKNDSSGSDDDSASFPWSLTMAYTTAPDLIPVPEKQDSGSGGPADPLSGQFSVDLGAVRSTEQTFLTSTSTVVEAYKTLSTAVLGAVNSNTNFGEYDTITRTGNQNAGPYNDWPNYNSDTAQWDPLDEEGQQFSASIKPQMSKLLGSVANLIESMGHFNALLNNAAQMYTDTDAASAFPAPKDV